MAEKKVLKIMEFSDPLCTWCWGSEPMVRKIETRFDNVEIEYVMGGMMQDVRSLFPESEDLASDIKEYNKKVAAGWDDSALKHHMPNNGHLFDLFDEENVSTFPMARAYKAAQMEDQDKAYFLLRRFREMIFLEGKKPNASADMMQAVLEAGLDLGKFMERMENGEAEKAFLDDIEIVKKYQVTGFPAFNFVYDGQEVLVREYMYYQTAVSLIKGLSGGKLLENEISIDDIPRVMEKYKTMAVSELAFIFDLDYPTLNKELKRLEEEGLIQIHMYGDNRYLKHVNKGCNNGVCGIE